mgnify:CR=1 FL=1
MPSDASLAAPATAPAPPGPLRAFWRAFRENRGAVLGLAPQDATFQAGKAFTGVVAALGMYIVATFQHNPNALMLSLVVWIALVGSCVASGISGAMVPLTLKRFGFDPATASSIFLTTATDVVSMGLLLGLATLLI